MFEGMNVIEIIKLLAPLIIIQVCLAVFCIFKLIKDRVRFLPKWVWALIIIIISTIGPAAYLVIGRERD